MTKARLEAFSDGVIAIIITIMVLELKHPHDPSWHAVGALWPVASSYLLSFFFVGVYWVNHHHLVHTIHRVNATIMWLNLHLLFWMSLIPFATTWLGATFPSSTPTVIYGAVMFMAGFAYSLLQRAIAAQQKDPARQAAHKAHAVKGFIAIALYAVSLPLARFGWIKVALVLYLLVAVSYVIPEHKFEIG